MEISILQLLRSNFSLNNEVNINYLKGKIEITLNYWQCIYKKLGLIIIYLKLISTDEFKIQNYTI